jgi:hypothetical protein
LESVLYLLKDICLELAPGVAELFTQKDMGMVFFGFELGALGLSSPETFPLPRGRMIPCIYESRTILRIKS